MKLNCTRHRTWLVASLWVVAVAAAACAPDATQLILSPRLGEQLAALEAGNEVVAAVPTEAPTLADLAPDAVVAGLPEDFAAALAAAQPANKAERLIGCSANAWPNFTRINGVDQFFAR